MKKKEATQPSRGKTPLQAEIQTDFLPHNDLNPEGLLRQALAFHQHGQLSEAEDRYQSILQLNPQHVDALQLLGALRHTAGKLESAAELMQKSLALNQNQANVWNNLGNVFTDLTRYETALENYDRAIALKPDFTTALFNRGNILRRLHNNDAAIQSYDQAILYKPDYAEAFCNRGVIFNELKQYSAALASYDQAIKLKPNFSDALNNQGLTLRNLQRNGAALKSFEKAIMLKPDFAGAFNNRGTILNALKQYDAALGSYKRAIALKPDFAEAFYNRGITLDELMRYDEALESYNQAIALKPDFADAFNNRGITLKELRRYELALESYERAIFFKPNFADAFNNRGVVQKELKQYDLALKSYEKAIQLNPNSAEAYWNKSQLLLLLGKFREGWKLNEWRWHKNDVKPLKRNFTQPLWLGQEPLSGTILLHAEQGLGDTIHMLRYAPLVAEHAKVIVEVPAALASLASEISGVSKVITKGAPRPAGFDTHCPLMSLPLAFNTEMNTIPAQTPYLFAPEKKKQLWSKKLGVKTKPRVGLVWSARKEQQHGPDRRNIPLLGFLPLLDIDAEFYSLQKEYRGGDLELLKSKTSVIDFSSELKDLSDTAALIDALDVVVSIDTAVAHLAGAMNKPVWILLRSSSNWRWLTERNDSPWYSSARIFRQLRAEDWDSVIDHVKKKLVGFVANARTNPRP